MTSWNSVFPIHQTLSLLATAQPPDKQIDARLTFEPEVETLNAPPITNNSPWEILDSMGSMAWPLGFILLIAITLILERGYFWWRTNGPGKDNWIRQLADKLKTGSPEDIRQIVGQKRDVYSLFALSLTSRVLNSSQTEDQKSAAINELVTLVDPPLRRFMHVLSSIITAAPMLGILGTVIGLIDSMGTLSPTASGDAAMASVNAASVPGQLSSSPSNLGPGIAQAMTTTAAGLIIALIVLFPYNAFRAQINRTFNHLERLASAVLQNIAIEMDEKEAAETESA